MRANIIIEQQRPITSLAQCCSNGLTATIAQAETWLANHDELQSRYKEKWATWEDACQAVYKMSRQAIHKRILKMSERVLSTTVDKKVDIKAEEAALEAVEEAREAEEEEPAAVHSADEKKQAEPKANGHAVKPKPPMDLSGCIIPQKLLPFVDRRGEVKELASMASTLKKLFERLQSDPDPLFAHIKRGGSVQTFMTGMATIRYQLAECSPDVVCPECEGKSDTCHYCDGTGWICEVRWNRDWVKSNDRLKGAEVAKRAANL